MESTINSDVSRDVAKPLKESPITFYSVFAGCISNGNSIAVGLLIMLVSIVTTALSVGNSAVDDSGAVLPIAARGTGIVGETALEPGARTTDGHPLDKAIALARSSLEHIQQNIDDYSGIMIKRERIGGTLGAETRMEFKIRARKATAGETPRPIDVYLKFTEPWLARGREVIWRDGLHDGTMVVHEGGMKNLMRLNLKPTDRLAMSGNKYPVSEIGLSRLVEKLIEKADRDRAAGPCLVEFIDGHMVGDRNCQLIQVTHPQPDPRFDFHIGQVYIDVERKIALRYAAYLWPHRPGLPAPLEEEYTFLNVRLNSGLTDFDFDPLNPGYQFP